MYGKGDVHMYVPGAQRFPRAKNLPFFRQQVRASGRFLEKSVHVMVCAHACMCEVFWYSDLFNVLFCSLGSGTPPPRPYPGNLVYSRCMFRSGDCIICLLVEPPQEDNMGGQLGGGYRVGVLLASAQ